ncbi:MAG TPA: MarR family winged helix-turn-helix transcriptional regulator [Acidimicrobiales bacterium]|jgi:DNA-binding MarR family transcriptional regulator|nr:MarR family winged helix-turn-helix transcriptional regulator [Acidimicrobiales bacterium]
MAKQSATPVSDTTLEREWGRLRRGHLMQQIRATNAPGHSPLEIELLRAIIEAGEIRASDLASRLFVTKTSISRYVNNMLNDGLLRQRRDPSDGRATLLSVSAAGQREFEEREARRSAVLHDICRDWPKSDVATLTKLLKRLNDGLAQRRNEQPPNA